MPKSTRIQDFRKINTEPKATPIKKEKDKGVASAKSKNKQKQKSNHKIITAVIILILITIGVATGCLLTPTFNLSEIKSSGQERVTKEEIKNKLELDIKKIDTQKMSKHF